VRRTVAAGEGAPAGRAVAAVTAIVGLAAGIALVGVLLILPSLV
jgi:hypothetical protein